MYYYLYDSYLTDKKYIATLAKTESKLTDMGINGKINRLSFLKNIPQILREEVNQGVKTIVVVGNDRTLNQIINIAIDLNVTFGYIPIGQPDNIARILGLPQGEEACHILSSRIINKLDVAEVNDNNYFLTALELSGDRTTINCDDSYFINLEPKNNFITLNNLAEQSKLIRQTNQGQLTLVIRSQQKSFFKTKETFSVFKCQKLKVTSPQPVPALLVDEKKILKTPLEIRILPEKIRMIVGKKRLYS
jgi:diacylglycerol kinase family enzyme